MATESQTDKDIEMEVEDEEASKTEEFQIKERAEIKILTKEKDEATGGVSSQLNLEFRAQKKYEARLYRLFTGFYLLMRLTSTASKDMECYWKVPVYIIIGVLGVAGYLFSRYNVRMIYLISIGIGRVQNGGVDDPKTKALFGGKGLYWFSELTCFIVFSLIILVCCKSISNCL